MADKEKREIVKVDKSDAKAKAKEKKLNARNAKLAELAKRPRRSPRKWFREARAEFKKVTWPTPKQVVKSTYVVLMMLTVAGIAIWGLDKIIAGSLNLILFGTWS